MNPFLKIVIVKKRTTVLDKTLQRFLTQEFHPGRTFNVKVAGDVSIGEALAFCLLFNFEKGALERENRKNFNTFFQNCLNCFVLHHYNLKQKSPFN